MRRPSEKLWELTRASDGPLRRVGDLEGVMDNLEPQQRAVLLAVLQDAIDTIHRLQKHHNEARRGIIR